MLERFQEIIDNAQSRLDDVVKNAEGKYLQSFYDKISEIYLTQDEVGKNWIAQNLGKIIIQYSKSSEIDRDKIRGIRESKGYTQIDLARKLGIHKPTISDVERGINMRTQKGEYRSNVQKYLTWLKENGY